MVTGKAAESALDDVLAAEAPVGELPDGDDPELEQPATAKHIATATAASTGPRPVISSTSCVLVRRG